MRPPDIRACGGAVGALGAGAAFATAMPPLLVNAGMRPVSSATTTEPADGKRLAGSFSSSCMTTRARSGGTSERRCSMGMGRSDTCLTRIAGVLLATNGGSPLSIWYPRMPSE